MFYNVGTCISNSVSNLSDVYFNNVWKPRSQQFRIFMYSAGNRPCILFENIKTQTHPNSKCFRFRWAAGRTREKFHLVVVSVLGSPRHREPVGYSDSVMQLYEGKQIGYSSRRNADVKHRGSRQTRRGPAILNIWNDVKPSARLLPPRLSLWTRAPLIYSALASSLSFQ